MSGNRFGFEGFGHGCCILPKMTSAFFKGCHEPDTPNPKPSTLPVVLPGMLNPLREREREREKNTSHIYIYIYMYICTPTTQNNKKNDEGWLWLIGVGVLGFCHCFGLRPVRVHRALHHLWGSLEPLEKNIYYSNHRKGTHFGVSGLPKNR